MHSGAMHMHVRKQLRDMGMCGSMLGPGPNSETEYLQGWVAGWLPVAQMVIIMVAVNECPTALHVISTSQTRAERAKAPG